MWGLIPAAGRGNHIQPLGLSKELLPTAHRIENGAERRRAVSEFVVERLIAAGVTKLCFVIGSGTSDILEYFGGSVRGIPICYVVQPEPAGFCDAIFRALPLLYPDEAVAVALPDTIWFPENALAALPDDDLSFLLFSVSRPESFEVVITNSLGHVRRIDVKPEAPQSSWIWGAFKMPGAIMEELFTLWCERNRRDEYFGTLVNAYLASGGTARAFPIGTYYVDVGALDRCRQAVLSQERGQLRALVSRRSTHQVDTR
jgi:glucose-1-phosphate thymidylyltransferase